LDVVLRIRDLLYAEKYTTEGARQRLEEDLARARRAQMPLELNLRESEMATGLVKAKRMVRALLDDLEKDLGDDFEPAAGQPVSAVAAPLPPQPEASTPMAQAEPATVAEEGDLLEGLTAGSLSAQEPPQA
jgi:hypothetical protein